MQNLKYLSKITDEKDRFGVILNSIAMKHTDHIQLQIAVSLLEFFNSGKFIDENDINKIGNTFYVPKEKYFKITTSKVFSIRINLADSEEEINEKISELQQKVKKFKNSK